MILAFSAFALWRWETAATTLPVYSGYARLDGSYLLEITLDRPALAPGDTTTLSLRIANQQDASGMPLVNVLLPPSLRPQLTRLPAGLTQNVQTGTFSWLPVVPIGSTAQELVFTLRAETADLTKAEQPIIVHLWPNAAADEAGQREGQQLTVSTWVGLPPQIDRVSNIHQVPVGQPVHLRPALSGSGPFDQKWALGDGRQVDVNDPIVVYPATGVYQITLEVANPLRKETRTHLITVVPHPAAQFTATDWAVGVGQPVTFVNESGGQPPLTYRWNFGDGLASDEARPTHTYAAPGNYLVQLTVANSFGESVAYGVVTVGAPPVADMVVAESVPVGQPLMGQAFGDESVQEFVWDMGDGRFYQGATVNHAYRRTGDFYVLLTASNEFGDTQVGRWIHVDSGALSLYLPLIVHTNDGMGVLVDDDLYALDLEPVELAEEFRLEAMALPANLTPAEQLFFYINEARARFDLPPLTQMYELSVAAQQHTNDMAQFGYTGHTGSDGSYPAERLLTYGYHGGYAGEATAWGYEHPYEAVEFWVNSPAHRRIILNRFATEVGVGFTVNFSAPNVWYWTAEFGNAYGPTTPALLRLNQPSAAHETFFTSEVRYRWNWPRPLAEGEAFAVYLYNNQRQAMLLGTVSQPILGTLYELPAAAYETLLLQEPGDYQWQVKLQQGEATLAESEAQPILFSWDPLVPTPTPDFTPTPTATPAGTVTPTPTPEPIWPTATPPPTLPAPPVFPTATPHS